MSILRTSSLFPLNTYLRADAPDFDHVFKSLMIRARDVEAWNAPEVFEGRKIWRGLLSEVRDQGQCGGCYAFAATSALSDGFNLRSRGEQHMTLSAARIILCDLLSDWSTLVLPKGDIRQSIAHVFADYGCAGNTLAESWLYLYTFGTNEESCFPDKSVGKRICSQVASPSYDECADGSPAVFWRAQHVFSVAGIEADGGDEAAIRKIIYRFGPVSTAIEIYEDFYSFDARGLYRRSPNARRIAGHAVVIDGWGIEPDGTRFWWVRNSWGKDWGLEGYFKMPRGENYCAVESNIVCGIPDSVVHISRFWNHSNLQDMKFSVASRRTVLTPYTPYGGIDKDTGISRRLMSYACHAAFPFKYRAPDAQERLFVAGDVRARKFPDEAQKQPRATDTERATQSEMVTKRARWRKAAAADESREGAAWTIVILLLLIVLFSQH